MKKHTYVAIILTMIMLSGCSKADLNKKDVNLNDKPLQSNIIKLDEGESQGVYSKKDNSVFCYNTKMNEADADYFGIFKDSQYAEDNNNVYFPIMTMCANCLECGCYCEDYIITGANPKTFKALTNGYAKDNNSAYYNGVKIKNVDLSSFAVINSPSKYFSAAKDKTKVFIGSGQIAADPETFEYLGEKSPYVWAKDKNKVWKMLRSDPKSLRVVEGADPQTFKL